ncbi:MAG: iron-containing alcohol dehydrogenase [Desulfobacterales bacterium]
MNTSDVLGKSFECECGRIHTVPTDHLIYRSDAVEHIPRVAGRHALKPDYLILADERTYKVAGCFIEQSLETMGSSVRHCIVADRHGESPVTDDKTVNTIIKQAPDADMYIAAGSGVVNDLTKWIAYQRQKPFLTFATAASMNGYASANVSASIDGLKVLFPSQACKAVFAVPEIIENAPFELTVSGLGDVIAKTVSSADWRLNRFLFDDYYCRFSVDLLKDLEPVYLGSPEKIRQRDAEAVQALFAALFYSGVAMTITGTSAPASGGEHLISHTIDMTSSVNGQKHDLHGRQVGVGTIFSAALYERVLEIEEPRFAKIPLEADQGFWGPLIEVVKDQYRKKLPKFEAAARTLSHPENWDNLRSIIKDTLLPPHTIKHCLKTAGAAHKISDIRIDNRSIERERFLTVVKHANQMRERFTVLDLSFLLGIMPEQAEDVVEAFLSA